MDRRLFLSGALASASAIGLSSVASADTALEASTTRVRPDRLKIDWSPRGDVAILASSDPDATRPLMKTLKASAKDPGLTLSIAKSPRPYLLLYRADGASVRVAERLLPLEGARNFRDLGGYRAEDGRQVRWGRIYRSGVMAKLTNEDLDYLSALGVEVVCDLRTEQERKQEPNPMLGGEAPEIVTFPYDMGQSIGRVFRAANRADAIAAFSDAYIEFAITLAPHYTDMFARLVRRETPLAVNCTAGKDRTGIAAALILSVLGVPRSTIVADYALSETYVPPSYYRSEGQKAGSSAPPAGVPSQQANAYSSMRSEVVDVVMGTPPEVMQLALSKMDAQFGGPINLAKTRYGLTDAKINHLRKTYLY